MRIFLLRRRHLVALLGVVLVLAIFAAVNAPAAVIASASTRQLPIYCVDRSDNLVSISFDAAWGNEDTQQLIEILDQYQVKATFFVVGDWVDKYPESVKALQHPRPLQQPHRRGDHCRRGGLQRQDRGRHRRAAHPHPLPLWGVRRPRHRRHPLHRHGARPVGCGTIPYRFKPLGRKGYRV